MSPEERFDQLESRCAIVDLVHAYARAMRHGRVEDAVALFTPDGWFETRQGAPGEESVLRARAQGHEQLRAFLAASGSGGKPSVSPLIHNVIVTFDSAEEARGNAMLDTILLATGQRTVGEYDDCFRRVEGRWLFASRTFTIQISG